ncbi:N-acetyltransferase [Spartobacteria bacterium LR76]|nr:N-acetyltransferase [Spartobacteria bacterium LR76]
MNFLSFSQNQAPPGFDPRLLVSRQVDEHLSDESGKNHCSLWWSVVPGMPGERPGVIGHFAASNLDEALPLLEAALGRLRAAGCTIALGPMDGNTWRRYRVLTERGEEPPFFMEPDNPVWWGDAFRLTGFSSLATYTSSLVDDLSRRDPRAERARARLEGEGIHIRNLNADHFEGDLRRIYAVSVESFTGNFLYTPIPESAFIAQYLPYQDNIRPEFVYIAEDQGEPVGYLFAIPDYAEAQRGLPVRTLIGKTLASIPGRRYGGLGVVLTDLLHQRARSAGFSRVIHALQYEGNSVRNMSEFFGRVMRRYTLYLRRLS